MFTPNDLENYKFQTTGRSSYSATDVDDFMDQITVDYKQMFEENAELVKRVSLLADRVQEYKNDEDSINTAIITAEKMKEQIISEAEKKAADIVRETEDKVSGAYDEACAKAEEITQKAENEAKELLDKAKSEYDEKIASIADDLNKYEVKVEAMKKEASDLKQTIFDICQAIKENVSSIEDYDFSKDISWEDTDEPKEEAEQPTEEEKYDVSEDASFDEQNYVEYDETADSENREYEFFDVSDQKTRVFDGILSNSEEEN
ncbi:MAG: DivIVA domain-containing protein [Clostridia bacterium]|nr:DivIVA domain-containing protein [Clostridia bacterium]